MLVFSLPLGSAAVSQCRQFCMPHWGCHYCCNKVVATPVIAFGSVGGLTHSRREELLFKLLRPGGRAIIVHQNTVREDTKELHWQPQWPGPLPA